MLKTQISEMLQNAPRAAAEILSGISSLPKKSRILLAGAGDNYGAVIAARDAFLKYSGLRAEMIESVTPIGLVNFQGRQPIDGDTLVIVSNLGESSPSTADYAKAAKEKGAFIAAITAPGDPLGDVADAAIPVTTGASFGGMEDYFKALLALTLVAASLSGKEKEAAGEIEIYLSAFSKELDTISDAASKRARTYTDNPTGEIIASGVDYGAGYLIRSLFYRVLGLVTTIEETEDWLHVNFLQLNPEKPATVVVLTRDNPAWDRGVRTLRYVKGIGRNATVITNLSDHQLEESYETVKVPSAPGWLAALTSYIPGALLIEGMAVK